MSFAAIRGLEPLPHRDAVDCVSQAPPGNGYFAWKRLISLALAAPLAVGLTPLIAVLWLAVRCDSRGPGFYSQTRLGRHRRPFTILKLRTMRADAEARTGPVWATSNDARVTGLGKFLRKYHLDELPQIYNVVWGDMSLVGPRPERPQIAENLARQIPGYYARNAVQPGITGMAQLHLGADESVDSVCAKLGFDVVYIERASAWLDVKVCLGTMLKAVPGLSRFSTAVARCGQFLPAARARGNESLERMLAIRRTMVRTPSSAPPKETTSVPHA